MKRLTAVLLTFVLLFCTAGCIGNLNKSRLNGAPTNRETINSNTTTYWEYIPDTEPDPQGGVGGTAAPSGGNTGQYFPDVNIPTYSPTPKPSQGSAQTTAQSAAASTAAVPNSTAAPITRERQICSNCSGTGRNKCLVCSGTGQARSGGLPIELPSLPDMGIELPSIGNKEPGPCTVCSGEGTMICIPCGGTGYQFLNLSLPSLPIPGFP